MEAVGFTSALLEAVRAGFFHDCLASNLFFAKFSRDVHFIAQTISSQAKWLPGAIVRTPTGQRPVPIALARGSLRLPSRKGLI